MHRSLEPGRRRGLALIALTALIARSAFAADPCDGYTWDVGQERALFASTAQPAAAGSSPPSAAVLMTDRLYQLALVAQAQVSFAAAPGRKTSTDGGFAGLASFQLAAPGTYRIALDGPLWVDVVLDGVLVRSKDFQGAPGCDAPHKIVEFDLPANRSLLLQLSGASGPSTRITITRAPAAAPKAAG